MDVAKMQMVDIFISIQIVGWWIALFSCI